MIKGLPAAKIIASEYIPSLAVWLPEDVGIV